MTKIYKVPTDCPEIHCWTCPFNSDCDLYDPDQDMPSINLDELHFRMADVEFLYLEEMI